MNPLRPMKQAASEAYESGKTVFERMKSISHAYRTHREMSVQEAVANVSPEIWLQKTSHAVTFANSNLLERRYRVCRSEEEILNLPEDSSDIFKRNMIDRYIDRPNSTYAKGKYSTVDHMCYAEFISSYTVDTRENPDDINDSQPEILENANIVENELLPKRLPLTNSKEHVKLRKEKCVLKHHTPNPNAQPEAYAHHLLFLYFPFRIEAELNATLSGTYSEKLSEGGVLDVINANKAMCEPYGDVVDEAFLHFNTVSRGLDPNAERENDDVLDELFEQRIDDGQSMDDEDIFIGASVANVHVQPIISDDKLHEKIRSLNIKQRAVFEIVNKWARESLKNLSSAQLNKNKPMHIFLTGSTGCGKSHLLTTIRHFLIKTLSYRVGTCDKDRVIVLVPTGVAAVNVERSTIHSALGICPERNFEKCVAKLADKKMHVKKRTL